jgi:cystathionine beta-lyase family protein involved in aluminum resistance
LFRRTTFRNFKRRTASLELKKENQADYDHKYKIGTYIESVIRKKLSIELKDRITFEDNKNVEFINKQGGQDIVVFLDGNPVYFIEVKSRWNPRYSISMSKLQLQRSVEQNQRYALCIVDITRYTGSNDRYQLLIQDILPLTKFVTNIGETIMPLIEDNLEAEKNKDKSVHLTDYIGIIPQDIIQNGSDFNKFIDLLLLTIQTLGKEKAL